MSTASHSSAVRSVTIRSDAGLSVTVLDRGATLQSIRVPTASGPVETILGYERLEHYLDDPHYLGTTVGRYANRIGGASFRLDGVDYMLDANEQPAGHCLHGGRDGLHRQFWSLGHDPANRSVECRHVSPDGAGGFPGAVDLIVKYQILDELSLLIECSATSDRSTVVSLANHAYFNLDAEHGAIDTHELAVFADYYTPVDATKIPTGEIRFVDETPFDLRERRRLADEAPGGDDPRRYDHNYALPGPPGELRRVAELYSPATDLCLNVHTTQPGLQLYTGDFLGPPFRPRQGLCLEAQHYPDSPNQSGFPTARLAPGERYCHRTIYEFSPGSP